MVAAWQLVQTSDAIVVARVESVASNFDENLSLSERV